MKLYFLAWPLARSLEPLGAIECCKGRENPRW